MKTISAEFTVIGGGSAGYAAARTAHDLGLNVVVIDGAETLGGLCILRGCMPSKTLIATSNRARMIRESEEFGIAAGDFEVKLAALRERKRRLIGEFADYRQGQLEDGRFQLIRGQATYRSANEIEVKPMDGDLCVVETKMSLIATGSKISRPPVEGLAETSHWTSDEVLDADQAPDSIIVLGGGAIALELAHFYEGIGKRVTVIQRSEQLLKAVDEDAGEVLKEASIARGIDVYTGTQLKRISEEGGEKVVRFEQGAEEKTVRAEGLLVATGRAPNLDGLGLDSLGLTMRGRSIETNASMETSVPSIYAAGDVCGPHELVHLAIEQGEAAAQNAAIHLGKGEGLEKKAMDYRLKVFGVFTEPEVAICGLTEREARASGRDILAASYPFDDHGKSMVEDALHGFVKLIADRASGEIIGGTVIGLHATELIHEIAVAMHFRSTVQEFMKIPHYHPTLSEIWLYPAEEIADELMT